VVAWLPGWTKLCEEAGMGKSNFSDGDELPWDSIPEYYGHRI
jgi:hypothetical protein